MDNCLRNLSARQTTAEQALARVWARVLGVPGVGLGDNFFELGGDSLSAAHLVVEIQKAFGLALPMATLLQKPTVAGMAALVGGGEGPAGSRLVPLRAEGTRPPFFCVHGVGGEVLCYTNLVRHLPADQPFYGIRSGTAADALRTRHSVESLAARYVEEVRALCPRGPYYLGGYSFGGSLAYEMARQLQSRGAEVGLLAVIDHTPPPLRYTMPLWRPSYLAQFLHNLPRWLRDESSRVGARGLLSMALRKGAGLLRRAGRKLGLAESGPGAAEVDSLFDRTRLPDPFRKLLEVHYEAMRNYSPQPYPGPVTLFRARTRPLLRMHGKDLGWAKLARGGVEVVEVPGNHDTILKEPHVGVLAARLAASLRKARADGGAPAQGGLFDRTHTSPAIRPGVDHRQRAC